MRDDPADPLARGVPHLPIRPDWLALNREPALDPAREIVDAHHHLWDRPGHGGRYLAEDLLADIGASGHRVVQTVYVQAAGVMYRDHGPEAFRPVGEAAFAGSVAEATAAGPTQLCAGIVGTTDPRLGDQVTPVLEASIEAAQGHLRGVRFPVAWHPDARVRSGPAASPAGVLVDPHFQEGARRVAAAGLSLDVWAYHTQLAEVEALARAVPELCIVLNHGGGLLGVGPFADGRDGVPDWAASMARLAALPNVVLKLGGLAMPISGLRFHEDPAPPSSQTLAEAWRPVVERCIGLFGPDRCMFESNFPVDKGMVDYGAVWNAFKRLTAAMSEAEKAALFAGTARRVYRL